MPFNEFETSCLEAHNNYRAKHGCPPLVLDENLCAYAREWAQHLCRSNRLQHRSNRKYGENLFMAMGQQVGGKTAVAAWYDEIRSFNFNSGDFSANTGHFTQVVWKGSQRVGVAVARNGNTTCVVANYDPPGNFMGAFRANVQNVQNESAAKYCRRCQRTVVGEVAAETGTLYNNTHTYI